MAYKVKTFILKSGPDSTYIQNYSDALSFVSEWKYKDDWPVAAQYNMAVDSDGNVYFKDGNYIRKYTEIGVYVTNAYRPTLYSIAPAGNTYIYYIRKVGSDCHVGVLNASDLNSAGSNCNLTAGKDYTGLVLDPDIVDAFYTFNRTDNKIEKWGRIDGKLAELAVGSGHDPESIALAGSNLIGNGGEDYWMTDKGLGGAITTYSLGYLVDSSLCVASIDEGYFLMTFSGANLGDPVKRYIRKYDSAGNIVTTTEIGTSELNVLVFTKSNVAVFSGDDVTTEAASSIGIDHAKGNGTSYGGDATERGFEVRLAFSGTLYEYIQRHMAGFSTGSVTYNADTGKWEGTITKTVTETGTFSAGSFTGDLGDFPTATFDDRLFAGETYDYRAYAIIGGTTYYGDWVEFTTATYPAGGGDDDSIPIGDIIVTEPPPEIIPEDWPEWIFEWPEYPPFEFPEFDWPEFTYPDIPSYDGSWIGWFYYRKAYTKRDLDELRKKCRIFQDNSVEYALVLNHNSRVLQQFLNNMTDYMGADEHNTFRPLIPPQYLNELARKPLDINDFKAIINNFISNSIDNTNNVNNNFRLIRDGLGDYTYTEDEGFRDILITTKIVNDNNPDVESLKKVIDRLNREMASNYRIINHNLHVLRAVLI